MTGNLDYRLAFFADRFLVCFFFAVFFRVGAVACFLGVRLPPKMLSQLAEYWALEPVRSMLMAWCPRRNATWFGSSLHASKPANPFEPIRATRTLAAPGVLASEFG